MGKRDMSAGIAFTKMHGLGNDFIVINNLEQNLSFTPAMISQMADRNMGIGCDQVLVIEKSSEPTVDFLYRIFNADGTEVGQCGNGARCLAKFIHDKKLSPKKQLRVKTISSVLELAYEGDNKISVNMGIPKDIAPIQEKLFLGLQLNIGNPHAVFKTDNLEDMGLTNLGLDHFNVEFMKVLSRDHIRLRVFERGVGETKACGSGACASVVAGISQKWLDEKVTVDLPGGTLHIEWKGEKSPVIMTGPAVTVFEGVWP